MDQNNNIQKSKPVPPFVRYCSAIIPTMFDDSLSYYEALCALNNFLQTNVIEVINNNATVTDEYIQLTKDLKSYVENYFENLDVQEEINNKLDEMAEDGTLGNILRQQYKDLERMIQASYSGSPIPVASTSDMTDTTRTYVNTTDGKWYYYDGDSWEIGGTYQATAVADGSVTPVKTTFSTRSHQLFNKNDYTVVRGQAAMDATVITANNNSRTLYIPCEGSTTYRIRKTVGGHLGIFTTAAVPAAGVTVSNVVNGTASVPLANQNVTYTTAADANYLCVFFYNVGGDPSVTEAQVANTIMISKGETDYGYEPYAYLNINDLLQLNSISQDRLKVHFLDAYQGGIYVDFANNKVKLSGLSGVINSEINKIYSINNTIANSEVTFPATTGLFALTATISGSAVTAVQLVAYGSITADSNVILIIDRTHKCYTCNYDYGNRIITEARSIALYKGKLKVNFVRNKVYFSSGCAFNYVNAAGSATAAYYFYDGFDNEVDIPSNSGLFALTATVSGNRITALQFEAYTAITPSNYVILYLEGGGIPNRNWYAPYNYGNRIVGNEIEPVMVSMAMFNSIGAIGDSYTQGAMYMDGHWYESPDRKQSYIGVLGRINGVDWDNYGVGGSTTKSWLTSPNGLAKVVAADPNDFYFLALGINDANQLGADYLGSIDDITADYTQNPDTFYGNYARIIEQVQAHAPKAKFMMIGCMRPNSLNPLYGTFTEAIAEIADHYSIPFADPYNDAFFTSSIMTTLSNGHPTSQGYCGIALALQRLFAKAVEENVDYFKTSNEGSNIITG